MLKGVRDRHREAKEAERIIREQEHAQRGGRVWRNPETERAATAERVKYEYKILTGEALGIEIGGMVKDAAIALERLLNEHAAVGWRVISMTTGGQQNQWLAPDTMTLLVVLEREVLANDGLPENQDRS